MNKYLNYSKQWSNRNKINSRVCLTLVTKILHKCKNVYSNICSYIIYSNICIIIIIRCFLIYLHTRAGYVTLWSPGFGGKTEIIVFQSGGFQSAQLFAFFIIQKVGWNCLREGLQKYCKGLVKDHINEYIYI